MTNLRTIEISNLDDIIDVRDVIERVEQLREAYETSDFSESDNVAELEMLENLLKEIAGYGGDEQWEGDWYPITLVRETYMREYAQATAEDCGMINANATWPNNCIDWEQATREFRMDYSDVKFDGVWYCYR